MSGKILLALGVIFIACLSGCKSARVEDTVYFMIGERSLLHQDSYILPLRDPGQIAQADAIAAGRQPAKIILARIVRGHGDGRYVNLDLASSNGRVWSWYVTEFSGFADITPEILDGWPGYVEDHLDEWLRQTNSTIGFWSYTILRRVDAEEIKP